MRLQLFTYHCGACGRWFQAPEVGELAYGEFLLRSPSGEMRCLNANLDDVFTEVEALLANDPQVRSLDAFRRADILNDVFGVACDPDSQGNEFRIGARQPCSHCGEHEIAEWESVEPPAYVDVNVPPVTHFRWQKLSQDEKLKRILAKKRGHSTFPKK